MNKQRMVEEFMSAFNQTVRYCPTWLPQDEAELRLRLIDEERDELAVALRTRDLVQIADGIGDLLYVVYGTAVQCGIDIDPIFKEIHRSNMTKKGGKLDAGGKWIKPSTYSSPKLAILLHDQIGKERSK